MADYKRYITQAQENGSVMISEDVVAAIAEHALLEVEGASLLRDIKNWNKGIKILIAEDNSVAISMNITVTFGYSVVEVAASAQSAVTASVENRTGVKVSDFFEDINFAADGGLYAEKIKNRSFEFDDPFMGWEIFGNVKLMNDGPFERNPHYVRLGYPGHPVRFTGIENEGFFGIGVEEGKEYRFTVWARTAGTKEKEYISFHLCQNATMGEEQMFESGYIEVDSKEWKKYEAVFTSPITEPKAAFRIFLEWNGEEPDATQAVDLEHISLFPVETFNGHENGLRKDIAETLQALDPGVFRFPGGCIVEGVRDTPTTL